ncbi:hypothetical protein AMQ83_00040, partial [Paenibacillus riograndensis]
MLYSFLGWVLEGSYNLYSLVMFRKEGFLRGPFKPMYVFAPRLLLAARHRWVWCRLWVLRRFTPPVV